MSNVNTPELGLTLDIGVPERIKTMQITNRHLMQLQLKLDNPKEAMSKKLACNIKHYNKSLCAYIRSKQNVQDKVGPEDSAGNIISQGFLMAEDLNGYFSSVFTREDISSLPVPDTKFQEAKSDYLGQLIVTPEMLAKKIKAMKDNKSPGVDGILPKLLMETVEQISIPLASVQLVITRGSGSC